MRFPSQTELLHHATVHDDGGLHIELGSASELPRPCRVIPLLSLIEGHILLVYTNAMVRR